MNRVDDRRLIMESIRNSFLLYMIAMSVIMFFEMVMIVRGIFVADFSMRSVMYMISYIILFTASLIGFYFFAYNYYKKRFPVSLVYVAIGYCTVIAMWAAWVSSIDMSYGHSMIVYYTVIMAMGGLVVIPPLVEILIVCSSVLLMFILGFALDFKVFSGFGDWFNTFVFSLFTIIVAFRHYSVSKKEYLLREKLKTLSFVDELTGLYNRRSFDLEISEAVEQKKTFIMILIDVDNFKKINDTYGHAIGDVALETISEILKREFGKTIYRYGGDEMAVICYDLEKDIKAIVNRINRELKDPSMVCKLGISAGYYMTEPEDQINDVITRADDGLYQAKEMGRGRAIEYHLPGKE